MLWLRWLFIALNLIYFSLVLFSTSQKVNSYGVREIMTPSGWINIWQLIGVGFVVWYGFNAWHLIWWFVLGIVVCIAIGKALFWMGYDLMKGQNWRRSAD